MACLGKLETGGLGEKPLHEAERSGGRGFLTRFVFCSASVVGAKRTDMLGSLGKSVVLLWVRL